MRDGKEIFIFEFNGWKCRLSLRRNFRNGFPMRTNCKFIFLTKLIMSSVNLTLYFDIKFRRAHRIIRNWNELDGERKELFRFPECNNKLLTEYAVESVGFAVIRTILNWIQGLTRLLSSRSLCQSLFVLVQGVQLFFFICLSLEFHSVSLHIDVS